MLCFAKLTSEHNNKNTFNFFVLCLCFKDEGKDIYHKKIPVHLVIA